MNVVLGEHFRVSDGIGTSYGVSAIYMHEDYESINNFDHDFAVLEVRNANNVIK